MSLVFVFGLLLVGAVVIDYGVKSTKGAFSSNPAGSAGGSSSSSGTSVPVAAGSGPVVTQVGQVLRSGGLSRIAAAGILGNAVQESSDNPAVVSGGNGGLWGFTAPPKSLSDLQAFASEHGADWTNPAVQAEFLLTQLSSSDISTLNSQSSPQAAAVWFMNNWEHPAQATENAARRIAGATAAYAQLGSVYL